MIARGSDTTLPSRSMSVKPLAVKDAGTNPLFPDPWPLNKLLPSEAPSVGMVQQPKE